MSYAEVNAEIRILPADTLTVKVMGTSEDARFEPAVLQLEVGDVIRFVIIEGLHTVTAYHPDNRRPLRMPESAVSFDSGMLTEGESWTLRIKEAGVYDYFCIPHERLGHAGRLIVGDVELFPEYDNSRLPEKIVQTLVEESRKYADQRDNR